MKKLDLTLMQNYKVISFSKLFEDFNKLKEIVEEYLSDNDIVWGSNPATLIELAEIIAIVNYFDNSRMRSDFLEFIDETYKIDDVIYVNLEN
jgi:hypothetical protein